MFSSSRTKFMFNDVTRLSSWHPTFPFIGNL